MFDRYSFPRELAGCECRKTVGPVFLSNQAAKSYADYSLPSLQTVSTPLFSVCFVRQMLYSLLGKSGLSDEGVQLLSDKRGIYRTHVHKCYCEKFKLNFREISAFISGNNTSYLIARLIDHLASFSVAEKYRIPYMIRNKWNDLRPEIELMYTIRNLIFHREGFISNSELYRQDAPVNIKNIKTHDNRLYQLDYDLERRKLYGIEIITNTVYLSQDAEKQILELTDKIFRFIIDLDETIHSRMNQ